MDWLVFHTSPARKRVTWSPEATALFAQIAEELSRRPGVKVALQLKRPAIMAGRRLAVAGHDDGIAVRLDGDQRLNALRIPGCRSLTRRDGIAVRGMVALPWAARDRWRELAHAAADDD